jgi:hypothetical protein
MTYLSTAPATCPHCSRVLFITRLGLWPWHYRGRDVWCVASDTPAPEIQLRAVIG